MENQKNLGQGGVENLGQPKAVLTSPTPPDGPETGSPEDGQPEEDFLYFNVMPKTKNEGPLIKSSVSVAPNPSADGEAQGVEKKLKAHKIYIIGAVALLIIGPAIYFLMQKLGSNAYKEESILVKDVGSNAGQKDQLSNGSQSAVSFTTPKEWRDKFFPSCTDASLCGDSGDPDHDGLINSQEVKYTADPNNKDSDNDGLADGDEVNVFASLPNNSHTAKNPKYTDADNLKGGYSVTVDGKKMTAEEISQLSKKMKELGLNEPTLTTLKDALVKIYNFGSSSATTPTASPTPTPSSLPSNFDASAEAKQDRDAQRSNTIKNIEFALVSYFESKKSYPKTSLFSEMAAAIKPYLKVATNFNDPVNSGVYVYSYVSNAGGTDFVLSFYSETQIQLIKKTAADAVKDKNLEQSNVYDNQRKTDLDMIRTDLLLYSANNVAGSQEYVFPTVEKYKTALVPEFVSELPKDPKTGADYVYQVGPTFDTFTLKAVFDNPIPGTTGYLCNQEECRNY